MSYRKSEIIDTRDLHERLEELQGLRAALESAREERQMLGDSSASTKAEIEEADAAVEAAEAEFQEAEAEELAELESLSEEVSEWRDGATLIPESEFTDYCRELLEDIGDLPKDLPGYIEIDWDKTADNLRADYSEVEYQGTTYLVRN